jgi:transmembrane sensor
VTENNLEIWNAISSVLNGNPSFEEKQLVEQWLQESESNRLMFSHLSEMGYDGELEDAIQAKERIYNIVQRKIGAQQYKQNLRFWQYVAAASVAIILSIGGLYFIRPGIFSSNSKAVANIETISSNGIKSKIVLSDGTIVDLNSRSSLSYPAVFNGKERVVQLNGEAYFEVAKDKHHPFIVKTGMMNIKVLGTHFNVNAYNNDDKTIVSLMEGAVNIEKLNTASKRTESITLLPNQQAILDKASDAISVQNVNASLFALWKEGQYYFENENFVEIARKLERGFNVSINITSVKLEKEVFSGVFDKGESIQRILDIMKKHRDFDYKYKDNKFEIFEYK